MDSACRMPMEAAELWMSAVKSVPARMPKAGLLKSVRMLVNWLLFASGETASLMSSMPYIKTAKPSSASPVFCFFEVLHARSMTAPMSARTGVKDVGFKRRSSVESLLMPERLKIQAVSVVPMFEPMMTPIVCSSSMIPEFTKPTSMTVNAEEDWIAIVMTQPSVIPFHLLDVIIRSVFSSFPPASFSSCAERIYIPKRKNASPPPSEKKEKTSMRSTTAAFVKI